MKSKFPIVKVYRNLKHGHAARPLYSVMLNGRIIARRRRVLLQNCKFVVNQAGRIRVIRSGRKNVHAFVIGQWVRQPDSCFGTDETDKRTLGIQVRYNPYKMKSFQTPSGHPIKTARAVLLNENGVTACYTS